MFDHGLIEKYSFETRRRSGAAVHGATVTISVDGYCGDVERVLDGNDVRPAALRPRELTLPTSGRRQSRVSKSRNSYRRNMSLE